MNSLELKQLLATQDGPCVSIYMPTHRSGQEVQQDEVRLKNLLREASIQLFSFCSHRSLIKDLLEPAWQLVNDAEFWKHQLDGLAVFIAPMGLRHFREVIPFPELLEVGRRFHVRPLIPLIHEDCRFYVLALSQNRVALYEGSPLGLQESEVAGLPMSLAEARGEKRLEKSLQFHTGTPGGHGKRPAVYHGQGKGIDNREAELERYFRLVDDHVTRHLRAVKAPLLVAAVERNIAAYRKVSRYPDLWHEGVTGNPDMLDDDVLFRKAWPIIEPYFRNVRNKAAKVLEERTDSGMASRDVEEVVKASLQGQVEMLFVDEKHRYWGYHDPMTSSIDTSREPKIDSEDLLDLAVAETLIHEGKVYSVPREEIPGNGAVAALFRY